MAYQVDYKSSVERDLKKLDKPEVKRILTKLEHELRHDPNVGEPLKGEFAGLFRLRVGDYRVIYSKTQKGSLVLHIAHRKDVYRKKPARNI